MLKVVLLLSLLVLSQCSFIQNGKIVSEKSHKVDQSAHTKLDYQVLMATFQKHMEVDGECVEEEFKVCLDQAGPSIVSLMIDQYHELAEEFQDIENPSEEEIEDAIESLTSDGETGEAWTCVIHDVRDICENEDEMIVSQVNGSKKMMALFQKHMEVDGECVQEEFNVCLEQAGPSIVSLMIDQYHELAEEFEDIENPSEEEIEDAIESLTSDGETGEAWTCVLYDVRDICENGDEMTMMALFQKHMDGEDQGEDRGSLPCLAQQFNPCMGGVDQSTAQAFQPQMNDFRNNYMQSSQQEQLDYIQTLTNDPQTGSIWTCISENTQANCPN